MPNGGVPINMAIKPKDGSPFVIHVKGTSVSIYDEAEWTRDPQERVPRIVLDHWESAALTWFLNYWFDHTGASGDLRPGYNMGSAKLCAEFGF
tara:strand:- start:21 stop:299 length:279 start_codon:yes stop_codon:yes gene_type:complete